MKTVNVGGRAWPLSIRAWEPVHRREASLVVLAASSVLLVSGLAVYFLLGEGPAIWVLVVLLVLLLLFEGALHAATPKAAEAGAFAGEAGGAADEATVPPAGETLTLRCGQCQTVFDLHDPGTRPLYHACPGCGAEGVLNAEDLPPPEPALAPAAAEPAPAAPAKPLRRLKLRCGACKEVFVVEDFGTRPLRHQCPGCGRAGELR